MQRSSSVSRERKTSRGAFRAAAALFAAITVYMAVLFVRGLDRHEIRSGVFTFAVATGAAAIGLWRARPWGRNLALVIALGNAGVGTLSLLSVIIARDGPLLGPTLLLAGSVVLSIILSLRVFSFPQDAPSGAPSDE